MKVPQSFTFMTREGQVETQQFVLRNKWLTLAMSVGCIWSNVEDYVPSPEGFPPDEQLETDERVPARLRGGSNGDLDVFALVRQHMSDGFLSQNPLLVMPQALKGETNYFMRMANSAPSINPWLNPERREELKNLADEIAVDFPHMGRAVTFYRSLLVENPLVEPYPRIKFLGNVAQSGQRWCQFNLGDRMPRPKPHPLRVTFHRGRAGG